MPSPLMPALTLSSLPPPLHSLEPDALSFWATEGDAGTKPPHGRFPLAGCTIAIEGLKRNRFFIFRLEDGFGGTLLRLSAPTEAGGRYWVQTLEVSKYKPPSTPLLLNLLSPPSTIFPSTSKLPCTLLSLLSPPLALLSPPSKLALYRPPSTPCQASPPSISFLLLPAEGRLLGRGHNG
eukprot:SM004409S16139  [mRNA]  locus=s4409:519:1152:+ [translate_table: standard]